MPDRSIATPSEEEEIQRSSGDQSLRLSAPVYERRLVEASATSLVQQAQIEAQNAIAEADRQRKAEAECKEAEMERMRKHHAEEQEALKKQLLEQNTSINQLRNYENSLVFMDHKLEALDRKLEALEGTSLQLTTRPCPVCSGQRLKADTSVVRSVGAALLAPNTTLSHNPLSIDEVGRSRSAVAGSVVENAGRSSSDVLNARNTLGEFQPEASLPLWLWAGEPVLRPSKRGTGHAARGQVVVPTIPTHTPRSVTEPNNYSNDAVATSPMIAVATMPNDTQIGSVEHAVQLSSSSEVDGHMLELASSEHVNSAVGDTDTVFTTTDNSAPSTCENMEETSSTTTGNSELTSSATTSCDSGWRRKKRQIASRATTEFNDMDKAEEEMTTTTNPMIATMQKDSVSESRIPGAPADFDDKANATENAFESRTSRTPTGFDDIDNTTESSLESPASRASIEFDIMHNAKHSALLSSNLLLAIDMPTSTLAVDSINHAELLCSNDMLESDTRDSHPSASTDDLPQGSNAELASDTTRSSTPVSSEEPGSIEHETTPNCNAMSAPVRNSGSMPASADDIGCVGHGVLFSSTIESTPVNDIENASHESQAVINAEETKHDATIDELDAIFERLASVDEMASSSAGNASSVKARSFFDFDDNDALVSKHPAEAAKDQATEPIVFPETWRGVQQQGTFNAKGCTPGRWREFEFEHAGVKLQVQVRCPTHRTPGRLCPLLVHLHSASYDVFDDICIRGDEWMDSPTLEPMFVLCPKCPAGFYWLLRGSFWTEEGGQWTTDHRGYFFWDGPFANEMAEALLALFRDVCDKVPVNPCRLFLSGSSMGGYGCLRLIRHYQGLFSACALVSAHLEIARTRGSESAHIETEARSLAGLPLWMFHGVDDEVCPFEDMQELAKKLGNNAKLSSYRAEYGNIHDEAAHFAFGGHGLQLFEWMLEQDPTSGRLLVPSKTSQQEDTAYSGLFGPLYDA